MHNHGGTQSHFGGRIVPARSTLTPEVGLEAVYDTHHAYLQATALVSDASPECKATDSGFLVCKRWLWRATSNCTATNGTLLSYGPGMSPQVLKPMSVAATGVGGLAAPQQVDWHVCPRHIHYIVWHISQDDAPGVVRGGTGALIDFSLPPGVTNGLVTDCSFTDTFRFGFRPGVSTAAVQGLAPMLACMEVGIHCVAGDCVSHTHVHSMTRPPT